MRNATLVPVFSLLLVIATILPGQEPGIARGPDFFPISVWYSGGKARAPMLSEITPRSRKEWREDLRQIKTLGFNTVRTWVEWAKCEPERGKYDFGNLRLLMELAEEVGLRVFIQMYADSAPDWVARHFPHGLFEAQSGDKVYPQSAPGACTDNPDVRQAVLDFYTEAAKVASRYAAFYGWDLWSEPHIINWAQLDYVPNVQFCFCPGTRARFRDWLKHKYGAIDRLNLAWYRSFNDWSEADPPRFSTILSYTDFIDWKTFVYEKLVDDLRMRRDAVRKDDPDHVITAHAVGASLFQSPYVGAGASDDFLMAEPVDFYGVSIYPKHNRPDTHWSLTTLRTVMDFTRSANRDKGGWYVGELQAGMGTIALLVSQPVTPDDHRIWIWSAIAKGAKGINVYAYFPMSSGYEAGGYGLINLDGTLTERATSAGKIADVVDRHQPLFLSSKPVKSQVAIVYNPLSQMVGGMQRRDYGGAHGDSLIGYFQVLADHNVPVDFVHRQHLERQQLSQYRLVIIPWPIMMTREAARGIRAFVEKGGHVLAEARAGWNDERGYAAEIIPGLGLHEVFGVREHQVQMRENENVRIHIVDPSHPATDMLQRGDVLQGKLYGESLTPLQNREVAILGRLEDGTPALVCSRFGQGEAMLVGSYLGLANHPKPPPANGLFVMNLLNWAQIQRPFTTSHDGKTESPVEVRLQENEAGYLLFILNHSATREEVTVDIQLPDDQRSYVARDIAGENKSTMTSADKKLQVKASMTGKHVQVIQITRK